MGDKSPYDYEEITVSDTAVGLTSAKVSIYQDSGPEAQIHVADAAICYRLDGGTPTADTVNFLEDGDVMWLDSVEKLRNFRAIRRDGSDAKLGVTYLR